MRHASIIPLIGGMTIAQTQSNQSNPDYLMTYTGFQANESHLLNYFREVKNVDLPYHFVDKNEKPSHRVDIINTTCPCAGLSQLSHGFGTHNENNQWMIKSTTYVLEELKPEVMWGENAPGFAGKIGNDIREQLRAIAVKNGYAMSIYVTKSLLHGTPQVRARSFYFFWKNGKVPLLNYFDRPHTRIEDLIRGVKSNTQMEPINPKTPSKEDPYYRFILEEIYGGITHKTFASEKLEFLNVRSNDVFSFIEQRGYNFDQLGKWMADNNYSREVEKCKYKFDKLSAGKNVMRRGTIVPYDYIGAFVSHYPSSLTHPDEDRYITYREAMSIMGLPEDFELLNPKKSANHICQNVPVKTALDMANEINAAFAGEREWIDSKYLIQYNHSKTHENRDVRVNDNLSKFF